MDRVDNGFQGGTGCENVHPCLDNADVRQIDGDNITDAALEALVVALTQRHGRLDPAQYIGDWTPPQQQRAHMITALARTLQTLLAEYNTGVLEELIADSGPL